MRRYFVRIRRIGAGTLGGAFLLTACQVPGPRVTPPASPVMPITVLVVPEDQDGERINQWGGIVPDTAPAVPVEDGGLTEPEPR